MALKLVILGLAVLGAASAAPDSRLVGGTPTTIRDFPYVVAITYHYPGPDITVQRCVGALISSWHVLTSGFCFTGAELSNMQVRAGSTYSVTGGSVTTITRFEKAPLYNEKPRVDDLAVAFLATPFPVTDDVGFLFLPAPSTDIPEGTAIKVASWGFESEEGPQLESLATVNLIKQSLEDCREIYDGSEDIVIDDSVFCVSAEEQGICNGDSGAPAAIDGVLVGIASHFQGCGDTAYPDVFVKVDRYTTWILEVAAAPASADAKYTGVRTASV